MKEKILVVEDDSALAEGLELILDDEGYSLLMLSEGSHIMENIEEFSPDLILLDYRLPIEDGGSITRKLRAQPKTSKIPIIMMSASQSNVHQTARDLGANAFLTKPFQVEDLIILIRNYLAVASAY